MPSIKKFDHSLIKNFLEETNLNFLTDKEGDFTVNFAYDEELGCELSFWFIVTGSNDEIYQILVSSDKEIPKSQWARVLMLCNTWNKDKRWPKAYLHVEDMNTDTTGNILLEEQIDLEQGIHQALLNDYTGTILSTAFQFWKWMHLEQGM